MKRILLSAISVLSLNCLFAATPFEPRDSWPYLYENFQNGAVRTSKGDLVTESAYNVCIADNSLHYIADGRIMHANMSSVYTARVNKDFFVNVGGKLYRVLAESDSGAILEGIEIDVDELSKVNVGYGVSVASGSQFSLNALAVDAGSAYVLKNPFGDVEANKFSGSILPTKKTTYLFTHNRLIRANKKDISTVEGVDKEEAASFIKQEKIKWKNNDSLIKLLEFVDKQLSE